MPTQKELIEMGQKAWDRKQRDTLLTKAHYAATKKLISAHQPEFDTYLDEAKRELGL
jgi:hypothetical protein